MFGNVRVLLRCGQASAFAKCFPTLTTSGRSRAIWWARTSASSRASALHRGSLTVRLGTAALPPLPETTLQNLLEAESRIRRYASCIAVYLRHDGSLFWISIKAIEERKQCCLCLHRSFSAEAALDTKDAAVAEEPSRALAAHEQERSVKKSRKESSRAASRQPSLEGRILDDSSHCIRHQDIPRGVWTALLKLRGSGEASSGCTDFRPAQEGLKARLPQGKLLGRPHARLRESKCAPLGVKCDACTMTKQCLAGSSNILGAQWSPA